MPFDTVTIGLVVGFAVGLTGMGAGTLMTPLLILVLGLRPTQAVGTALVVAALAKVVGSLTHLRQGTVDVRTVAILAAGSLPGSLAAGAVLWRLGTQPQLLEVLISRLVAVGLVLTAVALLLPARSRPGAAGRSYRGTWLAGGVAMGVLTPLTSIGAGSLTTVLLTLTSALPAAAIVGTNIVHGSLLALVGGGVHSVFNPPDPGLTFGLAAGAAAGVVLGSRITVRLQERAVGAGDDGGHAVRDGCAADLSTSLVGPLGGGAGWDHDTVRAETAKMSIRSAGGKPCESNAMRLRS